MSRVNLILYVNCAKNLDKSIADSLFVRFFLNLNESLCKADSRLQPRNIASRVQTHMGRRRTKMSYPKLASACGLALLLIATGAHAAQKTRTKSNNSNDRIAQEGVVLQDTAVGANACSTTGAGAWSWAAVSSVGTMAGGSGAAAASYARAADAQADIGAVCDSAQAAIDRINADSTKLDALNAAIETADNAAIETLLIDNGLSQRLVVGAQYHAINTKGTGATNGRMSDPGSSVAEEPASSAADRKAQDMPNRISMNVTIARVGERLSISVGRKYTGHVTLNR